MFLYSNELEIPETIPVSCVHNSTKIFIPLMLHKAVSDLSAFAKILLELNINLTKKSMTQC